MEALVNWKKKKSDKRTKASKTAGNSTKNIESNDILNKLDFIDSSVDKRALLEKIREERERRELAKYKRVRQEISEDGSESFFLTENSQNLVTKLDNDTNVEVSEQLELDELLDKTLNEELDKGLNEIEKSDFRASTTDETETDKSAFDKDECDKLEFCDSDGDAAEKGELENQGLESGKKEAEILTVSENDENEILSQDDILNLGLSPVATDHSNKEIPPTAIEKNILDNEADLSEAVKDTEECSVSASDKIQVCSDEEQRVEDQTVETVDAKLEAVATVNSETSTSETSSDKMKNSTVVDDELSEPNNILNQLWLATKAINLKKERRDKSKEIENKSIVYDENELVEWDSKHAWKDVPKLFWLVLSLCIISIMSFVFYTQYILNKGNQEVSNYKIRSLNDAEYVSNKEELFEFINLEGGNLLSQEDYDNDKFITNKVANNTEENEGSQHTEVNTKSFYALEGKGTKDEPYLIKNANDLVFIAEQIEDLPRKNKFRTSYFKQTADIKINDFTASDLEKVYYGEIRPEYNWRPIGSSNKPFAGHYDGAGHKINGLYYELDGASSSKSAYAGLFAHINSAEIKDLIIESAVILAKNHKAVGTLSAVASNDSKIDNVEINSYIENDGMVAGFIGKIVGRSVNLEAKNLKFKGRVVSYSSDEKEELDTENEQVEDSGKVSELEQTKDDNSEASSLEDAKIDKIHTAAAFVAEAEGLNLSNFVNEAEILSTGSAAGIIGHLSISSNQTIEHLLNAGNIYSHNLAAGLISSVDSAGSYKLLIKDNENKGEVNAKRRAAGILANISLYSSNNFSSDLVLENNINMAGIKGDVASAISARVLLDKGQYFSAINNVNQAKVIARKLAAGLISDLSFVGGNGTISQNRNEEGAEISTSLTDGRFLHGNAAGLIARLTFNIDKAFSNLRIINNSNKATISTAKIAAGLIAETNVRINTPKLDNEDVNRIEIAQNINFADIKNAHYISGLIGTFDILSSQDYFSRLCANNKAVIMIKNNAVYGNLINDIYESKNYMVGLFMGPKLNFRPKYEEYTVVSGEKIAEESGNSYLNSDILLSHFNRQSTATQNENLEVEQEYKELLEALGLAKESKDTHTETSKENKESVQKDEVEEEAEDFVNHKNGAITYLMNNLFAGTFQINDKNLDSEMTNDLLRNLRMQTAALGKLTAYTWVQNNYSLPYTNHFARLNLVTGYQYPMMIAYGNNSALNIKDASVVSGKNIHKESSYEGFDFAKNWAMDKTLGIPVPVQ